MHVAQLLSVTKTLLALVGARRLDAGAELGEGVKSMKIGKAPRVYVTYMVHKHA